MKVNRMLYIGIMDIQIDKLHKRVQMYQINVGWDLRKMMESAVEQERKKLQVVNEGVVLPLSNN